MSTMIAPILRHNSKKHFLAYRAAGQARFEAMPPRVRQVTLRVADAYGLDPGDIVGRSRYIEAVEARQVLAAILHHYELLSLAAVGRHLGRDHSTMVYSMRRVRESPKMTERVEELGQVSDMLIEFEVRQCFPLLGAVERGWICATFDVLREPRIAWERLSTILEGLRYLAARPRVRAAMAALVPRINLRNYVGELMNLSSLWFKTRQLYGHAWKEAY